MSRPLHNFEKSSGSNVRVGWLLLLLTLWLFPAARPAQAQASLIFSGQAVDESGQPITNLTLRVSHDSGTNTSGVTDENGTFHFSTSGAGGWHLQADLVEANQRDLIVPQYDFFITNHAVVTNIHYVVRRATSQISGFVTAGTNGPVAGVYVQATLAEEGGTNLYQTALRTEANGAFHLPVGNGFWSVAVRCLGADGLDGLGYDCVTSLSAQIAGTNGTSLNFDTRLRVPLVITTTSLVTGIESLPYYTEIQADGGAGGYMWEIATDSDPLPPGLNFGSDERGASLSGTPRTNGSFTLNIRVTDGINRSTNQILTLVINPAASHLRGQVRDDHGVGITNLSIYAAAEEGSTETMTDANGNFVLHVNAGNWTLNFDPYAVAGRGLLTSHFSTAVVNGTDQNDIQIVLPRATTQISGSVREADGTPVVWMEVTAEATMGGTLFRSFTGTDESGNYSLGAINGNWTIRVNNEALSNAGYQGVSEQERTIPPTNPTVNFVTATLLPVIKTATLPDGTIGTVYHLALRATGGHAPYQWAVVDGALPDGLTLATNGVLSGLPAVAGEFTVAIQAADSESGVGEQSFTFFIGSPTPLIMAQPESQAVFPDATVHFTVTSLGTPPLHYQWRWEGTNISGATNSIYTLTHVQASQQGRYAVFITNQFGSTMSSNAILTVKVPPTISTHPASQTVYVGTNALLSVTASGSSPLAFQWRHNGVDLANATNALFPINPVSTNHAGEYSVTVSNEFGVAVSSNAVLTVLLPAAITTPPSSVATRVGASFSLQVLANGTPPLLYQWEFNGGVMAGATDSTLSFTNIQLSQAGEYQVIVRNGGGAVTSAVAHLEIYRCAYALSTDWLQLPFSQRSGTVSLMTSNDCEWIVHNTNDWLTLSSTNGTGAAEITITAAETNTNAAPRLGEITIAGLRVQVMQLGEMVPEKLAGKTIRFAGQDYGAHLLVTRRGTNRFRLHTLADFDLPPPESLLPESGLYIFEKSSAGVGRLRVGAVETTLTFNSPSSGNYYMTNTTNLSSLAQSGHFDVLDTPPDYNGDDWGDLLWQKDNGPAALWRMKGKVWLSSALLLDGQALAPGWKIAAQYDFNADGHTDWLWHNENGRLVVWHLQGENFLNAVPLRSAAPGWRVAGLADFDHDQEADLLWQHLDGRVAVWFMQGETFLRAAGLRNGQPIAPDWQITTLHDFNNDGQTDILWHHSDGRLAVWHLSGTTFLQAELLRNGLPVASAWRVAGKGDFNLDGRMDLLWQHANGQVAVWNMNGSQFFDASLLRDGQAAGAGWEISH